MTSHLNLQEQEDAFEEAKQLEIKKIAKERGVSSFDAAQIWQDEYDDAVNNDY